MTKLGIIMDPISAIQIEKDSSFAMLLEAKNRGYEIHYIEVSDLYLSNGEAFSYTKQLSEVKKNTQEWYKFGSEHDIALKNLDVILMRKDPPFDTEYIYATYVLEQAERAGSLVINKPQSLRDCNEKLFATCFSKFTPDTLVTKNNKKLREFYEKHNDIILKPLGKMGGASIFRIKKYDPNINVIIETLTQYGRYFCLAQKYLPAINNGDKRILIVDGNPIPFCLARIPARGETRGNLAAGGHGEVRPLTDIDRNIIRAVAPILRKKGLIFVGLDIIGDCLTEINITSPTCICEIQAASSELSITSLLFDAIEKRLSKK